MNRIEEALDVLNARSSDLQWEICYYSGSGLFTTRHEHWILAVGDASGIGWGASLLSDAGYLAADFDPDELPLESSPETVADQIEEWARQVNAMPTVLPE